jgi:hypothetical protein
MPRFKSNLVRQKQRQKKLADRTLVNVKISDTVTESQRLDPRFQQLLEESQVFFNSLGTEHYKLMLGLHEGGHAYFARRAGATNIRFYGPTMCWDSRPPYDCPAISRSSIKWTPAPDTSVIAALKANIAGHICRREMSNSPNDEIAIGMDIEGCRKWFDDDASFKAALQDAERDLLEDLKSPVVVEGIWEEARRFVKEIFPAPKLTSAMLKAKRLVWA